MTDTWKGRLSLARGERLVGSWPVEPAAGDRAVDRPGWLILTSRRCLFYYKAGTLSERLEEPPRLQWKIEDVRSVAPQKFWMRIGSGDQVEMPGLGIDGYGFRLPLETSSDPIVAAILQAREARRAELGPPST